MTFFILVFPFFLFSQESGTSISVAYQIPYFQFKKYDYTSFEQICLKSYRIGVMVNHRFKNNVGLESQFSYHSDKIKQTFTPYLSPLPYDLKAVVYTFEYYTYSQGLYYSIKARDKFQFVIQTNARVDYPIKKQMTSERYDGFVSEPSGLPKKADENGLVFSGEIGLALKYRFSKKLHVQIAPLCSYYNYPREYEIDAQIRSVFSLELSLGYTFRY